MKVELLQDCIGSNPDFDRSKPVGPDNMRERVLPAGTTLEHPDCWMLCLPLKITPPKSTGLAPLNEAAKAKPADEECEKKVKWELQQAAQLKGRVVDQGTKIVLPPETKSKK